MDKRKYIIISECCEVVLPEKENSLIFLKSKNIGGSIIDLASSVVLNRKEAKKLIKALREGLK